MGAHAGDARRAQGTLSRLHFPACPLLKRACSLFLDRSSSLDGSLQGPGRGTKRYSQDSPPYTAPLSPKLPKNDRHPLEGEHSVSLPKAGCPQHPVLAAAGAHLPCPTEPWLQGAALLVPGMGCAWYSRGEWMSCCVVRQVPHTDVSGMWNAVGIPSNPDTHHLTLYNLVYLPTLCMGLTVLSLPSCLSPSAPRFFPEGLLQPIVQMLMCSCTASNLLTFPRISSCSSQAPLKQPGGCHWLHQLSHTILILLLPRVSWDTTGPCSQQQLQECPLWCGIHRSLACTCGRFPEGLGSWRTP